MMLSDFGFSEAIALIAVVVAFYYSWQNSQLTKKLSAREDDEAERRTRADLSANFLKIGRNYRLKVFNRGTASARNIRIEVDANEDSCFSERDIDSKFPHERWDPHQGVELMATIHLGSKSKHPLKLIWDDDFKINNEKMVYPTI